MDDEYYIRLAEDCVQKIGLIFNTPDRKAKIMFENFLKQTELCRHFPSLPEEVIWTLLAYCFKETGLDLSGIVSDSVIEATALLAGKDPEYIKRNETAWQAQCVILGAEAGRILEPECKCSEINAFSQMLRKTNMVETNYVNVFRLTFVPEDQEDSEVCQDLMKMLIPIFRCAAFCAKVRVLSSYGVYEIPGGFIISKRENNAGSYPHIKYEVYNALEQTEVTDYRIIDGKPMSPLK